MEFLPSGITSFARPDLDFESRDQKDPHLNINAYRDLASVKGGYGLIRARAIFAHIPDAPTAIRQVVARAGRSAFMYTRTPFVLAFAQIIPLIDITYPGLVTTWAASSGAGSSRLSR